MDSISVGLIMVQTLDTHVPPSSRAPALPPSSTTPRSIADLYPVGSWRDHPPTGVKWTSPSRNPHRAGSNAATMTTKHSKPSAGRRQRQIRLQHFCHVQHPPSLRPCWACPHVHGCAPGSNNWVIAGSHTASGKPLLSNDMHLTLREPDTWYMADLSAPGFHAAGVTLPGFPLVIAGHNDHVAWGFTALYGDAQDLYIEKLDGKGNYESASTATVASRSPSIPKSFMFAAAKTFSSTVQSTAHGPLLNPLLPAGDPPTALKWTLYDPVLNTLPLYEMNTASNWAEFSAALAAMVLAHAESRLRRRPGPHRLPRHRLNSDSACRNRRRAHSCRADPDLHASSLATIARMAGLHSFRPVAQRRRSSFRLSCHRQLPRHHRQISLPDHRRVGRSLSHRAHLQISRRPRPSHPRRHARRRKPTSTANSIRRWAIVSPTPSITLPALKAMAIRACARPPTSCAVGMAASPPIPPPHPSSPRLAPRSGP